MYQEHAGPSAQEVFTPEALRRQGSGLAAPTKPGEVTPASSRTPTVKSPSKMRSRMRHCGRVMGFVPWLALISLALLVGGLTIYSIKAQPAAEAAERLLAELGADASTTGFPLFMRIFKASSWATVGVAGAACLLLAVQASVRLDQKLRKAGKYAQHKGPYGKHLYRFLCFLSWMGVLIMLLLALWSVTSGLLLSSWATQTWGLEKGASTASASIASLDALGTKYNQALTSFSASIMEAAGGKAAVEATPAGAPGPAPEMAPAPALLPPPAVPASPPPVVLSPPPASPPPEAASPPPPPKAESPPPPEAESPPPPEAESPPPPPEAESPPPPEAESPPPPKAASPPPPPAKAVVAAAPVEQKPVPAATPVPAKPVVAATPVPAKAGAAATPVQAEPTPAKQTAANGIKPTPTVPTGNTTAARLRSLLTAAAPTPASPAILDSTLATGMASLQSYAQNFTSISNAYAVWQTNGLCPSAACLNMALYPFTESTSCVCTAPSVASLADLADAASKAAIWVLFGVAALLCGALLGCMEAAQDYVLLGADQLFLKVIRRKSVRSRTSSMGGASRGSLKGDEAGPAGTFKVLSPGGNAATPGGRGSYSMTAHTRDPL